MSKAAMAEGSMERCLLDMPHEILLEIFRRLPISKVIEISKLCSKFRDVAEDTSIWKYVYIKYKYDSATFAFAFEDLYSEPWPVKAIDLSGTKIKPPISSKIDQVVKVTKLNLSNLLQFEENKVIMDAILAKYQCKELNLDYNRVDLLKGIAPETFSKQTGLEVLSLMWAKEYRIDDYDDLWLGPILRNCQNLKSLVLSIQIPDDFDTVGFVESLPKSLEKLCLSVCTDSENYFFELLAERIPNLKELGWCSAEAHPALLKFQYLEALIVYRTNFDNTSDLCMYLTKFSVLKTLYVDIALEESVNYSETTLAEFRTILELHGIIVRPFEELIKWTYSAVGGNLWEVSN